MFSKLLLIHLIFFTNCVFFAQLPNKYEIDWIDCPSGTFLMGSPTNEIGRETDEFQHPVHITGFKIKKVLKKVISQLLMLTGMMLMLLLNGQAVDCLLKRNGNMHVEQVPQLPFLLENQYIVTR